MPKFFLFLSLLTATGFAQYTTGRVEGLLTDATGATVSGASVGLKSLQTNFERSFSTSDDGAYFFAAVAPGPYELRVEKTGFRPANVRIAITTSQTITQNLMLEVGEQPMRMEVVSEAASQFNSFEPVRSVTRSALELTFFPP
ncbi:MAG: carboxypeptidase-like regulatory domain-containing protein [Bryobacteraceae bacterium]